MHMNMPLHRFDVDVHDIHIYIIYIYRYKCNKIHY